jgi:hypothetical protein
VYRHIHPDSNQELPLRMLYEPAEERSFLRACEADSWRGLVAAMLDDPGYETDSPEDRLLRRLRLGNDAALILQLADRKAQVGDKDGREVINVASDVSLLRSLDRLGVVSLAPGITWDGAHD